MSVLQVTPVGDAGAPAARSYGEGRVCTQAGCGTRLNRFNPNDRCYVHERAAFEESTARYYVKPDERARRRAEALALLPARVAQVAEATGWTVDAAQNILGKLVRDRLAYRTGKPGASRGRGYIYHRATDGAGDDG